MTILFLFLNILPSSSPVPVQILAANNDSALVTQVHALKLSLQQNLRLKILEPVEVIEPNNIKTVLNKEQAEKWLKQAQIAYSRLETDQALTFIMRIENELSNCLDESDALSLLAHALRLKGLVNLYLEKHSAAEQNFVSSWFLAPNFSPDATEWPPETRLIYADTIARLKTIPTGALTIFLEPDYAHVWLDGHPLALGPQTVKDLLPGEHYLVVRAPGFDPFSARIHIDGHGQLNEATIYLRALDHSTKLIHQRQYLYQYLQTPLEALATHQFLLARSIPIFIVVEKRPDTSNTKSAEIYQALLFGSKGRRVGDPVPVKEINKAADTLGHRITRLAQTIHTTTEEPSLWYAHWYTWAAAGVLVVGTSIAITYFVWPEQPVDRVSFFIGRP